MDPLDEVDPPAVDAVQSVTVRRVDVAVREPNALPEVPDCEVVAAGQSGRWALAGVEVIDRQNHFAAFP